MVIGASSKSCYHEIEQANSNTRPTEPATMDIRGRRILYSIAITLFVFIAPGLLLYVQGYRFDFRTHSFIHTGGISIDSMPRGAEIHIDGEDTKHTTPAFIMNRYPGMYQLALTAPGFQSWSIRTSVSSANTSLINATLIPTAFSATYTTEQPILATTTSVVNGQIALLTGSTESVTVSVMTIGSPTAVTVGHYAFDATRTSPVTVQWSPHGRFLALVQPGGAIRVLNVSSGKEVFVDTKRSIDSVVWNDTNDNIFYALGSGTLWEIDLLNQTTTVVDSPHVVAAAIDTSALWVVTQSGSQTTLIQRESLAPHTVIRSQEIAINGMLHVYTALGRCIIAAHQSTYIYVPQRGAMVAFPIGDVADVRASQSQDALLLRSGSELWTISLSSQQSTMLVRSADVRSALWYPNRPVSILATGETIRYYDLLHPTAETGSIGPVTGLRALLPVDEKTVVALADTSINILTLQQ